MRGMIGCCLIAVACAAPSSNNPAPKPPEAKWAWAVDALEKEPATQGYVLESSRKPLENSTRRPTLIGSLPAELSSLATLPSPEGVENEVVGSFTMKFGQDFGWSIAMKGDLIADVAIGAFRAFTGPKASSRVQTTAARSGGPRARSTALDPRAPPSSEAVCPKSELPRLAFWDGVSRKSWTDASLDYVRYEGTFDQKTCRGVPANVTRVTAAALVPRLLYGFRRCIGCEWTRRTQHFTFIAPPSVWVTSTTEDIEAQKHPDIGNFSIATVAIDRGGVATASFTLKAEDLVFYWGLRGERASWYTKNQLWLHDETFQLSVELSWPLDEEQPSAEVFVHAVTPLGGTLLAAVAPKIAEQLAQ